MAGYVGSAAASKRHRSITSCAVGTPSSARNSRRAWDSASSACRMPSLPRSAVPASSRSATGRHALVMSQSTSTSHERGGRVAANARSQTSTSASATPTPDVPARETSTDACASTAMQAPAPAPRRLAACRHLARCPQRGQLFVPIGLRHAGQRADGVLQRACDHRRLGIGRQVLQVRERLARGAQLRAFLARVRQTVGAQLRVDAARPHDGHARNRREQHVGQVLAAGRPVGRQPVQGEQHAAEVRVAEPRACPQGARPPLALERRSDARVRPRRVLARQDDAVQPASVQFAHQVDQQARAGHSAPKGTRSARPPPPEGPRRPPRPEPDVRPQRSHGQAAKNLRRCSPGGGKPSSSTERPLSAGMACGSAANAVPGSTSPRPSSRSK